MSRILGASPLLIGVASLVLAFVASPALAQARLALLIGNEAYAPEVGPLQNPINDVNLIAQSLRQIGFKDSDITIVTDADRIKLLSEIDAYADRLSNAGDDAIGFFYYSGHGAANKRDRRNYLIPTGVKKLDEQVWYSAVALDDVVRKLADRAQNAAHFVVFDACRNLLNAPTRGAKGFVPVSSKRGMLIAFSTDPGETASDEGEGSGPYASALAAELLKPGLDHLDVFQNVKETVYDRTGAQLPWTRDGLVQRVFLGPRAAASPPSQPAATPDAKTLNIVTSFPRDFPQLDTSLQRLSKTFSRLKGINFGTTKFAAGERVAAFDVLDAVISGESELGWSFLYYWKIKEPGFDLLSTIPFGFTPRRMLRWRNDPKVKAIIDEMAARQGLYTIACGATGRSGDFWSVKPLNKLADLQGFKVRYPSTPGDILRKVGAQAMVGAPATEIFQALASGALEGVNWVNPQLDYHMKFHTVARYYYYPGYLEPGMVLDLFFNLGVWNELSETSKADILRACRANVLEDLERADQSDRERLAFFRQEGIEIQPLPREIRRALLGAWREVAEEQSERSPAFARLFATLDAYGGGDLALESQ